ncbi:class D sortase [Pseudobacillus badius]|uniref:class D sortase n=2 Tax=Bacillus badius TaxID=1455 RepID=UPI001CBED699|nr:class D sortase [Bacillus badius]MED0665566.1 class D sortase [Bacillus badius]UAT30504.1 class D sortase [Bacillus badius]
MRNFVSLLLILTGLVFTAVSLFQFYQHSASAKDSLQKAEQLVADEEHPVDARAQFAPKENEEIGVLRIPKIEGVLPIVEGTADEMLKKGVGHFSSTVFPGDKEQILLSGHRDTVFRDFGQLEKGDRFIIDMPYGTFEYEMREAKIVEADDTTVIAPQGEEVLTLSTCYPFGYIGPAPDRYVIYAYPAKPSSGSQAQDRSGQNGE